MSCCSEASNFLSSSVSLNVQGLSELARIPLSLLTHLEREAGMAGEKAQPGIVKPIFSLLGVAVEKSWIQFDKIKPFCFGSYCNAYTASRRHLSALTAHPVSKFWPTYGSFQSIHVKVLLDNLIFKNWLKGAM